MKKILLATSALVATSGFASAKGGGVSISGTAQMGIIGSDWVDDNANDTSYEFHTDIDVHFTMSGQTDTGLTFGASIDFDESDGSGTGADAEGASAAFDNRAPPKTLNSRDSRSSIALSHRECRCLARGKTGEMEAPDPPDRAHSRARPQMPLPILAMSCD